jgi:hypothetical protein
MFIDAEGMLGHGVMYSGALRIVFCRNMVFQFSIVLIRVSCGRIICQIGDKSDAN